MLVQSHSPVSFESPPRAPFMSFSNVSSSSSNTITPSSPRSPPSPLSPGVEDEVDDRAAVRLGAADRALPSSSPSAVPARPLASPLPDRPASFSVLRGARHSSHGSPAKSQPSSPSSARTTPPVVPVVLAGLLDLGDPLSPIPSSSEPSRANTPLPPPSQQQQQSALHVHIPDSSSSQASTSTLPSQKNPLAHTYGLSPAKRRRRVKSVSSAGQDSNRSSPEHSDKDLPPRNPLTHARRDGNNTAARGGSFGGRAQGSSDEEFDAESSSTSAGQSPKKGRSASGSLKRSSTNSPSHQSSHPPAIPRRRSSLVGGQDGEVLAFSPPSAPFPPPVPSSEAGSSSPSSFLAASSSAALPISFRARSSSEPTTMHFSPSSPQQTTRPPIPSRTSSSDRLPVSVTSPSKSAQPQSLPNPPPAADEEGSSCSCSTATTSSEEHTHNGEIGPLTPGGPEADSFPFAYEAPISRVALDRAAKGKMKATSFPAAGPLSFGDSSEEEGAQTFVDALDGLSLQEQTAAVMEPQIRHVAGASSDGETMGKVDKRVFKLWELVEGEVAYTEDLVTLVHIYLHHLFLLPSFTPTRRAAITRNTLDLLMLHKRFSKSLVDIIREEGLTATGGGVGAEERIVAATKRVAMVFAEEATDFASYEEYCAGHDEALSVIRQVESTPEWISYERRCSDLAKSRSRQNLDRLLSSPSVSYAGRLPLPSPSASSSASTPFSDDSSRLMLRDLLIKPIQRICRYPLVLASLLGSQKPTAEGDEGGGELETALAEMKVVASGVDEATRRKAAKGRTDIVLERMEVHPTLTPSILRSLDECLLVGALDVIYEHSIYAPLFPPVKVRYLAAFLYAGYLVLCKVKKGRVYQPTFFMALKSVQIEDCVQLGTDTLLPDSFRLVGHGYFFELATSGKKEKNIWLDALRAAKSSPTSWSSKPPTSAPEIFPARQIARRMSSYTGDLPAVTPATEPTTKRLSMPGGTEESLLLASSISTEVFDDLEATTPTAADSPHGGMFPPPAPRTRSHSSSLALNTAVATGQNPNHLFRRVSATHREAVDRSLADIFSESCSTARNLAQLDRGGSLSLYASPSKSSIGSAVSTVRRKIAHTAHSGSGSLSRRSSLVDMRASSTSSSLQQQRDSSEQVGDMTPKPSSSNALGISRTKSEIGFKREGFLRRSSMMPLWTYESQPAMPSESPIEREEDDALTFDRANPEVARRRDSGPVLRSRTESAMSSSTASKTSQAAMASELGQLLFPLTSVSPDETVPLHAQDKPPSSFKTMRDSIRRRSSFVEGWGASVSTRSKSVPASPTEPRRHLPLPVMTALTSTSNSFGQAATECISPLTMSPAAATPHNRALPPLPPAGSVSLTNLPSSSNSKRDSLPSSTPPTSRPGLLKRSLSSLSRRRTKSHQNVPALDPEMIANARRVSNSLQQGGTFLPDTIIVSPISLPFGVEGAEMEGYDPRRPSRSRTSSSDGSSYGVGESAQQSSDEGTGSGASGSGSGGGSGPLTLKRRKSSLRWGGFGRGLSITPVHAPAGEGTP